MCSATLASPSLSKLPCHGSRYLAPRGLTRARCWWSIYAEGTIVNMLAMAGGLGRWMDARDIAPGGLDQAAITEFRDALRAAGMRCVPGAHGLDLLLGYLEERGILDGCSSPVAPVEVLADRYRRWLVTERGLAEATVVRCVKLARSFLGKRLTRRGGLDSLSGSDVKNGTATAWVQSLAGEWVYFFEDGEPWVTLRGAPARPPAP